jgi:hypothetical protein
MKIDPFAILKEIHSAIDTELKTIKRYGATVGVTLKPPCATPAHIKSEGEQT